MNVWLGATADEDTCLAVARVNWLGILRTNLFTFYFYIMQPYTVGASVRRDGTLEVENVGLSGAACSREHILLSVVKANFKIYYRCL